MLLHVVRKSYSTGVFELIKSAPRFGILLAAITLSMIFTVLDIVASIHNFVGNTDGYVSLPSLKELRIEALQNKSLVEVESGLQVLDGYDHV